MPQADQLRRINTTYSQQTDRIRAALERFMVATWGSLGDYRAADIERWVAAVLPRLLGAEARIAALTDAQLAAMLTVMTGRRVTPVGVATQTIVTDATRGVPAAEVLGRAGHDVWRELGRGTPFRVATQTAIERAVVRAQTDLQLAKTHTARAVMAETDGVVGYRRILEGSHSCGLCITASTQRYHVADLMPIHPGCDCGVAPIVGDFDPGQIIDPDTLDGVHDRIQERFGGSDAGAREFTTTDGEIRNYRDVLISHEHGELGPVLAVRGQAFTGPSDLA